GIGAVVKDVGHTISILVLSDFDGVDVPAVAGGVVISAHAEAKDNVARSRGRKFDRRGDVSAGVARPDHAPNKGGIPTGGQRYVVTAADKGASGGQDILKRSAADGDL